MLCVQYMYIFLLLFPPQQEAKKLGKSGLVSSYLLSSFWLIQFFFSAKTGLTVTTTQAIAIFTHKLKRLVVNEEVMFLIRSWFGFLTFFLCFFFRYTKAELGTADYVIR